MFELEGFDFVIGADEVGYGAFAGPLRVAAVLAPKDWTLDGLNDSKKLSRKKREALDDKLWDLCDSGEIIICDIFGFNDEIDREGLGKIQKRLLVSCINGCSDTLKRNSNKDNKICAIVDGNLNLDKYNLHVPYKSVIGADSKVPTVMAASIIAKVYRDDYMRGQDSLYPGYDFANNVGYGTPKHQEGLKKLGVSKIHRLSYKPLASMIKINS